MFYRNDELELQYSAGVTKGRELLRNEGLPDMTSEIRNVVIAIISKVGGEDINSTSIG